MKKKHIFNIFGEEFSCAEVSDEKYELVDQDNVYYTTMNSTYRGEPEGTTDRIISTAYDYSYEDNIFILSGSLNLYELDEFLQIMRPQFDEEHIMSNKVRGFVCDESTQFMAISGEYQVDVYSPEEFVEYALRCKDTNLGLSIEVNHGIVTTIKISS